MSFIELGSQDSGGKKTPTLAQYVKANGGKVPETSAITFIFKPSKYPNWTFVCGDAYRCMVYEDSPLFKVLEDLIENATKDEQSLAIKPNVSTPGAFSLVQNTDEIAYWSTNEWGWKLESVDKPKQTRPKTNRHVKE